MKRSETLTWREILSMVVAMTCVSGCGLVTVDSVMDPELIEIEEAHLPPGELAKRIEEIDRAYSEPRGPAKVEYSLATAETSMSRENKYEGLWRAVRACAWLSENHPDGDERMKFARRGIRWGRKSVQLLSNRVESYYYLALCQGALASEASLPSSRLIGDMAAQMNMARVIEPTFDHCGSLRFLGMLMVKTEDYPGYEVGTFEEGLAKLREATRLCPDFGENHLLLAEALIEDEQYTAAKAALDKVLLSTIPSDYTTEHSSWLNRARELLTAIPVDVDEGVEVPARMTRTESGVIPASADLGDESAPEAVVPEAGGGSLDTSTAVPVQTNEGGAVPVADTSKQP